MVLVHHHRHPRLPVTYRCIGINDESEFRKSIIRHADKNTAQMIILSNVLHHLRYPDIVFILICLQHLIVRSMSPKSIDQTIHLIIILPDLFPVHKICCRQGQFTDLVFTAVLNRIRIKIPAKNHSCAAQDQGQDQNRMEGPRC